MKNLKYISCNFASANSNMFLITAICIGLAGHLSMAVPLESPSSDLASSLSLPLESPSSDHVPSSALQLESPSSDLTQYFDSRIVGGSVAPRGYAPHMVAIVVGSHSSVKSFICGASIISSCHVLIAAHCVLLDWTGNLMQSYHGVVGTNKWNHGGVIVEFKGYKNHPHYDPVNIKNDCAVLITSEKIKFSLTIQPIRLDTKWIDGGVKSFVTGWGTQELWGAVPNELQILYVETISAEQCKELINEIAHLWWSVPPMDSILEICTFHSRGHGMCHGDSGSALVRVKTGLQIGIVSWGFPCASGAPDIFTRIWGMFPFIKEVIRNHKCDKSCSD